ncbi:hypothetical protein [Alteromonas facilis]|uniref:hypothetical protein n=1 Tax=Alteromonas facilis TaxID=2048004 RepID=UPI000C291D66|nr:hypothetical protein [Alteromonas facilis]
MKTATPINANNIVPLHQPRTQPGWHYLIADNVVFDKSFGHQYGHGIRIQKPDDANVPTWIKRLITSGKCEAIYVENLNLNDDDKLVIQALCSQYSVSLIGLTVNDGHANNVIQGPW